MFHLSYRPIFVVVAVGMLAFLAGLGFGGYTNACRKAPESKAKPLLLKMRAQLDSWRGAYKVTPPSNLRK